MTGSRWSLPTERISDLEAGVSCYTSPMTQFNPEPPLKHLGHHRDHMALGYTLCDLSERINTCLCQPSGGTATAHTATGHTATAHT